MTHPQQPNISGSGGTSHSSTSSTSSGYPSSLASSCAPTTGSSSYRAPNGDVSSFLARDLVEHPHHMTSDWQDMSWIPRNSYNNAGALETQPIRSQMSYMMKTYQGRNHRKDNVSSTNTFSRTSRERKHLLEKEACPTFTPGVYQLSSCLKDSDDIYDYIPPRSMPNLGDEDDRDFEADSYGFPRNLSTHKSVTLNRLSRPGARSGYSSSCVSRLDSKPRNGFFYTSPRNLRKGCGGRGGPPSYRTMGSSLTRRGLHQSSVSSYALNNSDPCSNSHAGEANETSSNNYATASSTLSRGGGNIKAPVRRRNNVGCKTLYNLQKLGRRLGLTRFFRTLRIQNEDGSGETTKKHYLSSSYGNERTTSLARNNKSSLAPNTSQRFTSVSTTHPPPAFLPLIVNEEYAIVHDNGINGNEIGLSQFQDCSLFVSPGQTTATSTPLSSLPSNERIIETINRLKYQELHRRKERLAQEHRMMLREFKASNNGNASNNGSLSTFYVPNVHLPTAIASSSSGYVEEDEISTTIPCPDEEESYYQEPIDTKHHVEQTTFLQMSPSVPPTDRPSNESFSQTFARHLRRRISSSKTSKQQERKNGYVEEYEEDCREGCPPGDHEDSVSSSGSSASIRDASSTLFLPTSSSRISKENTESQENPVAAIEDSSSNKLRNGGGVPSIPPSDYEGPFKGTAVAMKDHTPSPYDRGALSFKKGDVIQIIATKPTGVWIGKANGQVGHFKFINVQVENLDRPVSSKSKQNRDSTSSSSSLEERPLNSLTSLETPTGETFRDQESPPIASVSELLQKVRLQNYIVLFESEGFETLDLFKHLEPEDLDRLGISNETHRSKLLEAARSLRSLTEKESFSKRSSGSSNTKTFIETSSFNNRFGGHTPYQFEYYEPPITSYKFTEVQAAVQVHSIGYPRDSGVYVGRDEGEEQFTSSTFLPLETESEEIMLSSVNFPTSHTTCKTSNFLEKPEGTPKNEETTEEQVTDPYEGVRSRFLQHKNFFESVGNNGAASDCHQVKGNRNSLSPKGSQTCERSSDSGISVCANSPPPVTSSRKEYRT